MSGFIITSCLVSLAAIGFVFFPAQETRSTINKGLLVFITLVSTAILIYKVSNFQALDAETLYSDNTEQEYVMARNSPNSIVAWNALGRKYLLEKKYINAYMAYSEAEQLDGFVGLGLDKQQTLSERLKWLTGLAEARILAQSGSIDTKSNELINATLALDARHPKALWYGGLAAAQQSDFLLAQQRWNQLLQQNPPAALRDVVQNRLNLLNVYLQSQNTPQPAQDWTFKFKLKIDDSLLAKQQDNTQVFVSLRQAQQAPPLVARRFSPSELQTNGVLSLGAADTIAGMSANRQIDWQVPVYLSLVWSPSGTAISPDNTRVQVELSDVNLDSVFEYTLK